jgi:cytochrome c oxidase assembly protein Cox11
MHPAIKISLRIGAIFALLFFASKPYNFFCNFTNKCQPFYFSALIPKQEGKIPAIINFEVTNYREGLDLQVSQEKLETVANRKNTIIYYAKNLSKNTITFRPQLIYEPEIFGDYLETYQCLCKHSYKLKPGEKIELRMVFFVKKEFFQSDEYGEDLKIRYLITNS